jgi:hypothetical protein
MGFKPLIEDPCVYIRQSSSSFTIIYVDDAIIAAPTKEEVDEIKREIRITLLRTLVNRTNFWVAT